MSAELVWQSCLSPPPPFSSPTSSCWPSSPTSAAAMWVSVHSHVRLCARLPRRSGARVCRIKSYHRGGQWVHGIVVKQQPPPLSFSVFTRSIIELSVSAVAMVAPLALLVLRVFG